MRASQQRCSTAIYDKQKKSSKMIKKIPEKNYQEIRADPFKFLFICLRFKLFIFTVSLGLSFETNTHFCFSL